MKLKKSGKSYSLSQVILKTISSWPEPLGNNIKMIANSILRSILLRKIHFLWNRPQIPFDFKIPLSTGREKQARECVFGRNWGLGQEKNEI